MNRASGRCSNDCSRSRRASVAPTHSRKYADEEPPLRSELFSADQMEQHGKNLALAHRLAPGRAPDQLLTQAGRERRHPGGSLRPADGGGHDQPPHHTRRGMAARQLLSDRGADPHGQAAPAQGIQPRASPPGGRTVGQTSACLRSRVRSDRPWRRQGRRGEPFPFRGGLPDGDAAQGGGVVGHSHHAATGAHRESSPRRRPDCDRHDRPEPGRCVGGPDGGNRRAGSQEPDSGDCGHGAIEPADGELVRRRTGAPAAGTERRAGLAAHLDRAATIGVGLHDRAAGAIGNAEAGRRPGFDQQHDRQPALSGVDGLARVRRDDEHRRAQVAGGSGRALRQDGFRDPRSVPARRRGDRKGQPAVGRRRGAQGDPARARRHGGHRRPRRRRRSRRPRRFLSGRQGSAAARTSGEDASYPCRGHAQVGPADPAAAVPRLDRGGHDGAHGDAADESTWRWRCRCIAGDARRPRCCWPPASWPWGW